MKSGAMGQVATIRSKEEYTLEELFDVLKKGNYSTGGPELRKVNGFMNIVFPGESGFCNLVGVTKDKITMTQHKESAKGKGLSIALDAVTGGWASMLNAEGRKNQKVMEEIAQEIERLVS